MKSVYCVFQLTHVQQSLILSIGSTKTLFYIVGIWALIHFAKYIFLGWLSCYLIQFEPKAGVFIYKLLSTYFVEIPVPNDKHQSEGQI